MSTQVPLGPRLRSVEQQWFQQIQRSGYQLINTACQGCALAQHTCGESMHDQRIVEHRPRQQRVTYAELDRVIDD